jgi:hypothetical protein
VAVAKQVRGDAVPHAAQSDESDLHDAPYGWLRWGCSI